MRYRPPRFLLRRYELLKHIVPAERFLEIGPGNLLLTRDLAKHFERGIVVELNPDIEVIFDQLPSNLKEKLALVTQNFITADIPGKFDCIVACEVLEHISDETVFMRKAASMLKPGGQLIISVPAREKFWGLHDENVGHIRRYERNNLKYLMHAVGLVDVVVIGYGYPFINILRLLRNVHAKTERARLSGLDQVSRSMESGLPFNTLPFQIAGLICNPITFAPLCITASMFNRFDLSEGYLVVAHSDSNV